MGTLVSMLDQVSYVSLVTIGIIIINYIIGQTNEQQASDYIMPIIITSRAKKNIVCPHQLMVWRSPPHASAVICRLAGVWWPTFLCNESHPSKYLRYNILVKMSPVKIPSHQITYRLYLTKLYLVKTHPNNFLWKIIVIKNILVPSYI